MTRPVSTKDKILHILKKDVKTSIKEIMDYFTISEVAIRRHLNDLTRQGFVKEEVVKQEIGRPYHLYSLTDKGHQTFPNQYEQLPIELLEDLEELEGKEVVRELLLQRKKREEKELAAALYASDFTGRIAQLINLQEKKGYMIEYEENDDQSIEIKNFNCPIYTVASKYKEICTNENNMYENLFPGSKISFNSCMTSGEKYCGWVITNSET